jgi:hypothetical protein
LLIGNLVVKNVPGNFHIEARSVNHNFHAEMTNMSHTVNHLSFGVELTQVCDAARGEPLGTDRPAPRIGSSAKD